MQLGIEQQNAADRIIEWLKTPEQCLVIGGYAGTGKTTVARWLQEQLGTITFACFTGKGAYVLRNKGCKSVGTIHSLIYRPIRPAQQPLLDLRAEMDKAAAEGNKLLLGKLVKDVEVLEEKLAMPAFEINEEAGGGLIIVDEYSMLNTEIVNDLKRTYKKILFMGDPFQLPPVSGECPLKPALVLEEIHRQAGDSAIIEYATKVRNMEHFSFGDWGDFNYIPECELTGEMANSYEQIICGKNATRNAINNWRRGYLGIKSRLPIAGETMMCLRNNKELGVFNGMELTVEEGAHKMSDNANRFLIKFKELKEEIMVWEGDILGQKFQWRDKSLRGLQRFDFCHAITAHKSQGSEFDSCLVMKEPIGEDATMRARWLYTALTRGKNKVTLVQQG